MSFLQSYVNHMNTFRQIFNDELIPEIEDFSQAHVNAVMERLYIDFEPENLHEDGEISMEEADRKYNYYLSVHEELMNLGDRLNLNVPDELE